MKTLGKVVGIAVLILVMVLLFGFPVMLLWNWLMVDLFKLPPIDFLQAVGILLLCRMLFTNSSK